jgi:WD40 repeat protein
MCNQRILPCGNAMLGAAILLSISVLCTTAAAGGLPRTEWMRGGAVLGVNDVVYSRDARLIATAGDDDTVKIFDAHSGYLLHTMVAGASGYLPAVAFSPDGKWLASANDSIAIWDVMSGQLVRSWKADALLAYALEFSPDGQLLASGGMDKLVKLWNPQSGSLVRTMSGHTDIVYDVAFSPDGVRLASASDDETLRVWNVGTGASVYTVKAHDWFVIDVDYSPDGSMIATTGGLDKPQLKLWRAEDGAPIRTINVDPFSIGQCEWAPDQLTIITSARYGLKVWDVASGALLRSEPNGDLALAISPDGSEIASSGSAQVGLIESETVYQRAYLDLGLIRELTAHSAAVRALQFSPDQSLLASGCDYFESSARFWDAGDGEQALERIPYTSLGDGITHLVFSRDGEQILISGMDGDAKLFHTKSGSLLQTYEHGDLFPLTVYCAAFHPKLQRVLTGGNDGNIKVWRKSDGSLIDTWFAGHDPYSMDFSPSGDLLAVGTNGGIVLLDALSGEILGMITGHASLVRVVEFTPSGKSIVSASSDHTAVLWDVATGARLRTFTGHTGPIVSMDLSPAGDRLITCATDGTVRVWDAGSGEELANYDSETGREHLGVSAVAFRDSREFAYGRGDGTVVLAKLPELRSLRDMRFPR